MREKEPLKINRLGHVMRVTVAISRVQEFVISSSFMNLVFVAGRQDEDCWLQCQVPFIL